MVSTKRKSRLFGGNRLKKSSSKLNPIIHALADFFTSLDVIKAKRPNINPNTAPKMGPVISAINLG